MPDNLFERIDGPGAVEAAVDLFYRKVLMDDEISNFLTPPTWAAKGPSKRPF